MRPLAVLVAAVVLWAAAPARAATPQVEPPPVTAAAWILYDDTYERRLGALEEHARRPMASTTKMMTALVVRERASLEEQVVVSQRAADVGEAEIGLVPGEVVAVGDLLAAIMVGSANDAAIALAEHVGGSVEAFVDLMNLEAAEMGLTDTRFVNPHGLDQPGHYSSAADLLQMGLRLMEDPVLARLAGTRSHPFPDSPTGRRRVAQTTNQLLRSYPGALGIKTGFTGEAGLSLVAAAEQDGRRLFSVVLGSEDHFADTVVLLEFGFEAYGPEVVISAGAPYALYRAGSSATSLRAVEEVTLFMAADEAERVRVVPMVEGEPLAVALLEGRQLARVPLTAPREIPLPDLREAAAWASRYWDRLWGRG